MHFFYVEHYTCYNIRSLGGFMVKDLCFEILNKCPNKCMFCSSNSCMNRNTFISLDDFKRVIDYFVSTGGIEELSLSGGEPLLHPNLLEMIGYASKLGIKVTLFTSGIQFANKLRDGEIAYFLKEKEAALKSIDPDDTFTINSVKKYYDNILKDKTYSGIPKQKIIELKNAGLSKIVFDIQAYEYETDEILMGRKESMRVCLLDSLFNATFLGMDVDVHFIPNKLNYKEILDLLELIEIVKVPNISLLNFVPQGRGKENASSLALSKEEKEEFFSLLEQAKKVYSGNIRIGIPLSDEQTHACTAGLQKIDIKYDGTILPCPAFKELSDEEYQKYGIKHYNIYENLDDFHISGVGTRAYPLCKKVYGDGYGKN